MGKAPHFRSLQSVWGSEAGMGDQTRIGGLITAAFYTGSHSLKESHFY
jgi:hypothetical protein